MQPESHDMARLWDMPDAALSICDFLEGVSFEGFMEDRKTRNAVERNLEIIGEAARGVSDELRVAHPEIPWRSIIGLRNIIAHEYGEVRHENIWRICTNRLPALVSSLKKLGADSLPPDSGQ